MKAKLPTILVILTLLLCACRQQNGGAGQGSTLRLRYAENLTIVMHDGYTVATLKDPWHEGRTLRRYVLVEDSARYAQATPPVGDATVVRVPLRRSVVFNTAHASLLCMLDSVDRITGVPRGKDTTAAAAASAAVDAIAGVADLKYMQLPEIHRRVADGRIADCGDSMSPTVERIIDLQADAILLSPFENSGGYGRLEEIGVPIIECAEYMETSALGRAEWMLFYGLLYGKGDEALRLFNHVVDHYHVYSKSGRRSPAECSILTEKLTGNTWYVAGGKSTVAQMIADAGGSYAWSSDTHSGSLALSFETVLDRAGEADVWIFNDISGQPTYQHLLSEYHGYGQLRAFRNRNVWYVNSMQVPYFEEVSFRPDLLLRDYCHLLHPVKGMKLRYFKPLQ